MDLIEKIGKFVKRHMAMVDWIWELAIYELDLLYMVAKFKNFKFL